MHQGGVLVVSLRAYHSKGLRSDPEPLIIKKSVSIMATNHLKTGVERTPVTSCVSNIRQTVNNVQHSVPIMNEPLLQTLENLRTVTPLRWLSSGL
jgi:hypothetical protein